MHCITGSHRHTALLLRFIIQNILHFFTLYTESHPETHFPARFCYGADSNLQRRLVKTGRIFTVVPLKNPVQFLTKSIHNDISIGTVKYYSPED